MPPLPLLLAAVEGGLFAVGVLAMIVQGLIRTRGRLRVAAASQRLARGVTTSGRHVPFADLSRLRPAEAAALLGSLATQLRGAERSQLVDLATRTGVLDTARRRTRSRSWRRRLYGTQVLAALGPPGEEMAGMLGDLHPLVRAEAARTVAGRPDPGLCRVLARMLDDDSLACRLAAKDALLRIGPPAVHAVTDELLGAGGSPRSTVALLEIAARQADPRALTAITVHAGDGDPVVRAAAIAALGIFGGREARGAVLERLAADPHTAVRLAAIEALGRIGVADDARLLVPGLSDDDWNVRRTTAIALCGFGAVGRLQLRRIARGAEGPAAQVARWVLEVQGLKLQEASAGAEIVV